MTDAALLGTDYSDIDAADDLGDLKSIRRVNGMRAVAPRIRWGKEYEALPTEEKLDRAEKLANTMNHAADVLQQERQGMIAVANKQEEVIKQQKKQIDGHHQQLQNFITRANAEKQTQLQQIVDLDRASKAKSRRIRELEKDLKERGDHD